MENRVYFWFGGGRMICLEEVCGAKRAPGEKLTQVLLVGGHHVDLNALEYEEFETIIKKRGEAI